MASNFLGQAIPQQRSSIISANELVAREGVNLLKGMNYRDKGPLRSVFLVLPRADGYHDEWNEATDIYVFEGHDSTTVESGKAKDQLSMYQSGRLSENGKFLKAARGFIDGVRKEPLEVQIYEKLDPGVWFDKGIFNLVDAELVNTRDGKVFRFMLGPAGSMGNEMDWSERMMPAGEKAQAWERAKGRCEECRAENNLTFIQIDGKATPRCQQHGGRWPGGLL